MRKNFKYLHEAKKWLIKDLSAISGISEKILIDIENGNDFDVLYLFELCSIYRI